MGISSREAMLALIKNLGTGAVKLSENVGKGTSYGLRKASKLGPSLRNGAIRGAAFARKYPKTAGAGMLGGAGAGSAAYLMDDEDDQEDEMPNHEMSESDYEEMLEQLGRRRG